MKRPTTGADGRPRIHIKAGPRVTFTYGARGIEHQAESVGAAVETAIAAVGGRDAVIIYSGDARA